MTIQLEFYPWSIPGYANVKLPAKPRGAGYEPAPLFALSERDPEALAEMCDEFRRGVFKKAGKRDPGKAA